MNDPGEITLFQTEDGQTRIDVRLVGETGWLYTGQMEELKTEGTVAYFATVQKKGDREVAHDIEHSSLNVIISECEILTHAGKITAEAARALAEQEYERYRRALDSTASPVEVHFDEAVTKAKQLGQAKKSQSDKREDSRE